MNGTEILILYRKHSFLFHEWKQRCPMEIRLIRSKIVQENQIISNVRVREFFSRGGKKRSSLMRHESEKGNVFRKN